MVILLKIDGGFLGYRFGTVAFVLEGASPVMGQTTPYLPAWYRQGIV